MSVVTLSSPALLSVHSHVHPHQLRRQRREEVENKKAMEKHRHHLERPEVKAGLAEATHLKKVEKALSNQFPLDTYIANRGPLPNVKVNPFANVHGTQAKANLEKMGLEVEANGSSHFAVRTKPVPGHPHGHRLGTLPVHPHESIPSGTHHEIWDEMNENLIGFLNHADDNTSKLPVKTRNAFRHFVAEKLADAGAKSSTEILPKNLLSTKDHKTIKSIQTLIENANPDTVFDIWKDRSI